MNIILDSNVVFSALIRDSTTRKIIFEYDGLLFFPKYIFDEFQKHEKEIIEKSRLSNDEFKILFEVLLSKTYIVPYEIIKKNRKFALELVKEIDILDAPIIACALAYENSIIWSDDKKLKNIEKIQVI